MIYFLSSYKKVTCDFLSDLCPFLAQIVLPIRNDAGGWSQVASRKTSQFPRTKELRVVADTPNPSSSPKASRSQPKR